MSAITEANAIGQRIWLDNLSRALLHEGALSRLIEEGVAGLTSNPTIFYKAISDSPYYQNDLAQAKTSVGAMEDRYETLVIPDIQAACDLFRPLFDRSAREDGYVSLEVSPALAYDQAGTVAAAKRLFQAVNRPNLMIKVPGTPEGRGAIEQIIAEGINVNVTLMFSLQHVVEVALAYTRGLRAYQAAGGNLHQVKSVASLFLSRVDTVVDNALAQMGTPAALALQGKTAVAMSKLAYQRYKELFHGEPFRLLREAGGRPQYLLWASTGTKNPAYSDLLYVEPLIGPETVNTMPDTTLNAFRDHGKAKFTLEQDVEGAMSQFLALEKLGIDMHEIGDVLQRDGVRLFSESFDQLLALVK